MDQNRWRKFFFSDVGLLVLLALSRILLHALTNHQYGFHRDELATMDDARHLAWGYVAYPPLTPFIGRIGMELFGPATVGVRFFSSLAQGAALVLTGLIARELGGNRWAVLVAGMAVWVAPLSFIQGTLFQYVSFDYFWWVTIAYCMVRLLKSEEPRWWLGIGAAVGLGMMTRYTMAFCVVGLVGGVLLTPNRRYLKSRWLWAGAALALLIFLPNLIWQIQHNFISLEQMSAIHERDVRIGRTDNFVLDQLLIGGSPGTVPLWLTGLWFYFFMPSGRQYRALGWMYVIPLLLFTLAQGRGYYTAAAYPMLLAAGAVVASSSLGNAGKIWIQPFLKGFTVPALVFGAVFIAAIALPIIPVNSDWWDFATEINSDLKEEIGWPELVKSVAQVYDALPEQEKQQTGIFANNYGEAGAINMYGPDLRLPTALSGVNSYWLRGYGNPPPQTLVVVGYRRVDIEPYFETCELAGNTTNPYHVDNEESRVPDVFVCRRLREPWPEFWQQIQHFG